jgi:hypothetical protein
VLERIEKLSEIEQLELLEQIALKYRRPELTRDRIDQIRAKLPKYSERQLKRIIDPAVRQVRRELARSRRP